MIFGYIAVLVAFLALTNRPALKNIFIINVFRMIASLFLMGVLISSFGFWAFLLFLFWPAGGGFTNVKFHQQFHQRKWGEHRQGDWHQGAQRGPFEDDPYQEKRHYQHTRPPTSSGMSEQEASIILGVRHNATEAEIKSAYRSMMKEHHPDKGGDPEFAAKINNAKDTLLRKYNATK